MLVADGYDSVDSTLRPTSILALIRQRLYRKSEAPLKLSHVLLQPYNIGVARKPITTLRRLLTNRDLTKPRRRRQRERQKTIGLMSKTTTLHVHHAFLYIYLPLLLNYDVK